MSYTLSLRNIICQLYLYKDGKEAKGIKSSDIILLEVQKGKDEGVN